MADNQNPQFSIQRVYLKDASFEAPSTPDIFRNEWQPKVDVELNTTSSKIAEDVYEVVVGVTVTAKSDQKSVFLVEVKQAGIFVIKSFPADQMAPMLGIACPTVLYPYAREVVTDLIMRGSFPQLILDPVNFEALYLQNKGPLPETKSASEKG